MNESNYYSFFQEKEKYINKNMLNIILLIHVQQPRGYINNSQLQCNKTEYFSIDEFNEIYQGIVTAGYFIQAVYYNEIDFISDFIKYPLHFKNCLIYNLSRNGIGTNKKTSIPAFCDLVGLTYSTSSSFSNALCRNKYYFTTILQKHHIPTPKSWLLNSDGSWVKDSPINTTLVICKPCSESASQGINESKIFYASSKEFEQLKGTSYIVQEYIDGEECEVPVFKIGNKINVLPPVGIDLGNKRILDEKSSETNNYNFYCLKNTQSQQTISKVCQLAKEAFILMQMDVYGRIDFRINSKGEPYIFDISTTPYTTHHSSFAFAFQQMNLQYDDIYRAIIAAAIFKQKF